MDIEKIISRLSMIPGVAGLALGGSRSRDEATVTSDYDIGIYYYSGMLDIKALSKSLTSLDDHHRETLLNPPGDWGPWINGGGWLTVDGNPVDLLLRDLSRVEAVLGDCISGIITIDYQCGHPFGFVNTIYAAETHYCKPLWQDSSSPLDRMKALLYSKGSYSPFLKDAMIKKFTWEASFSVDCGSKAAYRGDVNYAAGSVFRAVCSWLEVLYALNDTYLMNEKGALPKVDCLALKPDNMEGRVKTIYKLLADGNPEEAYALLEAMRTEIGSLTGEK